MGPLQRNLHPVSVGPRGTLVSLAAAWSLCLGACSDWADDDAPLPDDDTSAAADDDSTAEADDDSEGDDDDSAVLDDDTTPVIDDDTTAVSDDDTTPVSDDDSTPPADDDTTPSGTDADGDGWYAEDEDCDDSDGDIHPGAEELCDDRDNDCDGTTDEGWDDDGDSLTDCHDDCPTYVNGSATAPWEGTLTHPFAIVQDGIDHAAAAGCGLVLVAQGIYYENLDFAGAPVRVQSVSGPEVTTIDGGAVDSVVRFASGESGTSQMAGFTLTHGQAEYGGAIYVDQATPVLEDNLIVDNRAVGMAQGGGIYVVYGGPVIRRNLIAFNTAGYGGVEDGNDGGAIFVRTGSCLIEGNDIRWNQAGDGGGIWLAGSSDTLVQNRIVHNDAWDDDPSQGGQGGGIEVHNSVDLVVSNNLIAGNTASAFGGGIALYEGAASPLLHFNTLAWNTCDGEGGGILIRASNSPDIRNNIVFQNAAGYGLYTENDLSVVTYGDVFGNEPGDWGGLLIDPTGSDGNLSADPLFVTVSNDGDPDNDDWHLQSTSPARNAGDPDPSFNDVDGSRADMGAYGGPEGAS